MKNTYTVTVQRTTPDASPDAAGDPITFTVTTHDALDDIIAKVSPKGRFADDDEIKAFCVGLKLFSGVMLRHRTEPLFAALAPSFGAFMKGLKAA